MGEHSSYYIDGYKGVRRVETIDALMKEQFVEANCLVLPRSLSGDFNGLARAIRARLLSEPQEFDRWRNGFLGEGVFKLDEDGFAFLAACLNLSGGERQAAQTIVEDLRVLGGQPSLGSAFLRIMAGECEAYYERRAGDFHIDPNSENLNYRLLCSYVAPVTEGLRNDFAVAKPDAEGFFDPLDERGVFRFHPGDLSRHREAERRAFTDPRVLRETKAFIHRGVPGDLRLLLVAG